MGWQANYGGHYKDSFVQLLCDVRLVYSLVSLDRGQNQVQFLITSSSESSAYAVVWKWLVSQLLSLIDKHMGVRHRRQQKHMQEDKETKCPPTVANETKNQVWWWPDSFSYVEVALINSWVVESTVNALQTKVRMPGILVCF